MRTRLRSDEPEVKHSPGSREREEMNKPEQNLMILQCSMRTISRILLSLCTKFWMVLIRSHGSRWRELSERSSLLLGSFMSEERSSQDTWLSPREGSSSP